MNIIIINQEAVLPPAGYGGRSYFFNECLNKCGQHSVLINSTHSHLNRNNARTKKRDSLISVPVLPYKKSKSVVRMINWVTFTIALLFIAIKMRLKKKQVDFVYYSSPQLFGVLGAIFMAKLLRAQFIFEFRDIWPLTLVRLGNFGRKHPAIWLLSTIEKLAIGKADLTISSLPGGLQYLKTSHFNYKRYLHLRSGISKEELDAILQSDASAIPLSSGKFNVVYAGAHGVANNLNPIIEAAWQLKHDDSIHFHFIGDGEHKLQLEEKAKGLCNIHFHNATTKAVTIKTLQISDCLVISWHDSSLYEYGTSSNKMFDYMAASRPIINMYSGGFDIIQRFNCGITIPSNSVEQLAATIIMLKNDKLKCDVLSRNGLKAVQENFLYEKNAVCLIQELEKLRHKVNSTKQ